MFLHWDKRFEFETLEALPTYRITQSANKWECKGHQELGIHSGFFLVHNKLNSVTSKIESEIAGTVGALIRRDREKELVGGHSIDMKAI